MTRPEQPAPKPPPEPAPKDRPPSEGFLTEGRLRKMRDDVRRATPAPGSPGKPLPERGPEDHQQRDG